MHAFHGARGIPWTACLTGQTFEHLALSSCISVLVHYSTHRNPISSLLRLQVYLSFQKCGDRVHVRDSCHLLCIASEAQTSTGCRVSLFYHTKPHKVQETC